MYNQRMYIYKKYMYNQRMYIYKKYMYNQRMWIYKKYVSCKAARYPAIRLR